MGVFYNAYIRIHFSIGSAGFIPVKHHQINKEENPLLAGGLGFSFRKQRGLGMEHKTEIVNKTVKTGVSFGSALAMVISYTTWKSVGWAILHGLFGWAYVIYFLLVY